MFNSSSYVVIKVFNNNQAEIRFDGLTINTYAANAFGYVNAARMFGFSQVGYENNHGDMVFTFTK